MNRGLKDLLLKIIIGVIFSIIILIIIFRTIVNKIYNKVIENLNEKVDRITELSETDIILGINIHTKYINELESEIKRTCRYNINLSLIMFDVYNSKI